MKKIWWVISFALVLVLAVPVWAAEAGVGLRFDGIDVSELQEELEVELGAAELMGGRVYLPVRLAAALFGAEVEWPLADGGVGLRWSEGGNPREARLLVGSSQAVVDGQAVDMGAAPFVRRERTYVPLRLLEAAFGCEVSYNNGRVDIRTASWELEGQRICGMANDVHMTSTNSIYQNTSPYQARKLYELIMGSRGEEVAPPALYGVNINLDSPDYYWQQHRYFLLTADSRFLNAWETWELYGFYVAMVEEYALDFGIYWKNGFVFGVYTEPPEGYTRCLLEIGGRWYTLPEEVGEAANGFGWGWEKAAGSYRD